MKLTHKVAQLLGAATFGMTILAAPAAMADTTLAMSSWLPARHPIVVNAFKPWAQQVEDVTEGRVKIRILAKPLGPPPAHFDMAADGVADITYGLHSFTTDDRFVRSRIGQFSFTGDDAASGRPARIGGGSRRDCCSVTPTGARCCSGDCWRRIVASAARQRYMQTGRLG